MRKSAGLSVRRTRFPWCFVPLYPQPDLTDVHVKEKLVFISYLMP